MVHLVWVLILSFFVSLAYGQQNPCLDIKTIRTVKVPWDPTKPKSATFDYRFKYELVNPLSPTVVILPGGPGQTSIVPTTQWPLGAVPANYNKIYIDPRSQGCNYAIESSVLAKYLKTEFVVNDIFLALKSLDLKNYIIYGASYGTIVATQLAKKIETEKFELPMALVLEGAVGKKYDNFDSYFYFFQYEWDTTFKQLPPRWKTYFQTGKNESAFSKSQWASLISSDMIIGDVPEAPVSGNYLFFHLRLLELYFAKKITPKEQPYLPVLFSKLKDAQFPNLLFRMIGCGEIWGDWYYGRSLENGRLVKTGKNVCEGIEYSNPYDAAKFQVSKDIPIYYFQGTNDPATPLNTALYHFAVQQKTNRQFFTVANAAHAPLSGSLRKCADGIWDSIYAQRTLGREFASCPRQTVITSKKAN